MVINKIKAIVTNMSPFEKGMYIGTALTATVAAIAIFGIYKDNAAIMKIAIKVTADATAAGVIAALTAAQ